MMVNIGRRVASVNIAFSSSRNAALIECKMLQYITLSMKNHLYKLSEIKTQNQVFTMSDVLVCVSVHCADQSQHSIPDFLTKSIDNTLQMCVDTASEYPQVYNTSVVVKGHVFVVCINVKVQDIQRFCLHLFSPTNIFENKINLSTWN